jgi:enamine deaminase RidA (YjgF/YER057c/UK114 family)
MVERSVEIFPAFKLYITSLPNQSFISGSITSTISNPERSLEELYTRIAEVLTDSSSQIILERCFSNIDFQSQVIETRTRVLREKNLDTQTPLTYIEGKSCSDNRFAGVQIRALKSHAGTRLRTIFDQGIPKGRTWNLDGSTCTLLQNINGWTFKNGEKSDRKIQSDAMFRQAERMLRNEGSSYGEVVRTWIYISNILDWYDEFNTVRNHCYSDFGFLGNTDSHIQEEQIYLPASTGIEGRNPAGLSATMDVLAIHRTAGSTLQIRPIYGVKQRSPFRYGSAFSRAMVIEDSCSKMILVSGTASIDEEGKSIFLGDPAAQIRQSLHVVSALVAQEGATLQDLCEATVFIKHKEDFSVFQEVIREMGDIDIPSINVLADVCRDELLFELDAAFILGKDNSKTIGNS